MRIELQIGAGECFPTFGLGHRGHWLNISKDGNCSDKNDICMKISLIE